jgi:DNA-binding PadR family transcriptional regulator
MTEGQYAVLKAISSAPLTVSRIIDYIPTKGNWTYHRVHGILRRLEDDGWVRRVGGYPTKWELTRAGTNRLSRAQSIV